MTLIPQSMKKSIALWVLNYGLKMLLSNPTIQDKQKQVISLINCLLDSLRDMKLTEEELVELKKRVEELFKK